MVRQINPILRRIISKVVYFSSIVFGGVILYGDDIFGVCGVEKTEGKWPIPNDIEWFPGTECDVR
jgi:hypothetical protein